MSNVPPPPDQSGWSNSPQSQPAPGYGGQGGYGGPAPAKPSNGIGIAALVVGIVSLVLSWIPFLGLLLAIVAIVLGILGIRKASKGEATNKGMAITGVVTGGLALLVGAFVTIGTIAFFGSDEFQNLTECLQQAGDDLQTQQDCQVQFQDNFGQ
ncbi:hypothetical protein BH20ACT1_BH20ACT1_11650 [soil metagenome]